MSFIDQLDEIVRLTVRVVRSGEPTTIDHHEMLSRRNELVRDVRHALTAHDAALNHAYAEGRKDEAEEHAWRPIETAPEDEHILLALRLGHHSIGWWTDDGDGVKWFHQGKPHESLTPVAWMPLPTYPEASNGN